MDAYKYSFKKHRTSLGNIKVLQMIRRDMAKDATKFDGQPFDGRTVAQYLGHMGAAIAAMADVVMLLIKEHGEN